MLNIYHYNIFILLNNFFFIIFRIFSILHFSPFFGDKIFNKKIRFIFSFLLSIFIILNIPYIKINILSYIGLIILIEQIIIGIIIGFFLKLIFFFVIISGEILSFQVGLSFLNDFDSNLNFNASIFSKIFNIFLLLIFLFFNGHLWIIFFILKSFYLFPINHINFNNILISFIKIINSSFLSGIILIFPIMILLFLLNILTGILFQSSSNMFFLFNNFSLFFFISLLFLFFSNSIFFYSLNILLNYLINIFNNMFF